LAQPTPWPASLGPDGALMPGQLYVRSTIRAGICRSAAAIRYRPKHNPPLVVSLQRLYARVSRIGTTFHFP
jgi:hypothetical protein